LTRSVRACLLKWLKHALDDVGPQAAAMVGHFYQNAVVGCMARQRHLCV
jgi:hypothetical protein